MEKLEKVYELIGAMSTHVEEEVAIKNLEHFVRLLELSLKTPEEGPDAHNYLRMNIGDVAYWLFVIAGKRGYCQDCMADYLQVKLVEHMKKLEMDALVLKPKIKNESYE